MNEFRKASSQIRLVCPQFRSILFRSHSLFDFFLVVLVSSFLLFGSLSCCTDFKSVTQHWFLPDMHCISLNANYPHPHPSSLQDIYKGPFERVLFAFLIFPSLRCCFSSSRNRPMNQQNQQRLLCHWKEQSTSHVAMGNAQDGLGGLPPDRCAHDDGWSYLFPSTL